MYWKSQDLPKPLSKRDKCRFRCNSISGPLGEKIYGATPRGNATRYLWPWGSYGP